MSLDVRVPNPDERRGRVFKKAFWPVAVIAGVALIVAGAMVLPRWLGVQEKLEADLVKVQIYNAENTRTQVIVGTPEHNVVAQLPDGGRALPDGGREFMLSEIINVNHWPRYKDKYALIQNAQVQRILGENVIAIGTSPQNQIFVRIRPEAKLSKPEEKGADIDAKSRVNVAGYLRPTPPAAEAPRVFNVEKLNVENVPLPPLYMEAKFVKVVKNKPNWGME
ncbi:MAG: hypothetical protein QOJ65_2343 [Fimbriimonadaceae bacterium]|nr:hypothetical protein [Fimbriimonadaceae bacterium]